MREVGFRSSEASSHLTGGEAVRSKSSEGKFESISRRRFLRHSSALAAAPLGAAMVAPFVGKGQAATAGTIRYLAAAEDDSVYVQKNIIPQFQKETGITVQIDQVEYVNLYTKEVLELRSSNYDVYQVDQVWVQAFAKSGYLVPLDGEIPADMLANFHPNLMKISNVNGKQWAVPFSAIPVNYTYRKDLTQPAKTWTEALDIAKKNTKPAAGGALASWGFPIRGQAGNPITWTWLPMLWSFGGDAFDADYRPTYNNEAGLESVSFYKELYQYSPPGWLSDAQVAGYMEQGQGVQTTLQMVFDAPMSSPQSSKVADKIGFAGMPKQVTQASILGLWNIGVSAKSANKDNAVKFVEYLSRPEVVKQMALAGVTGAPQPAIYSAPGVPSYFPVLSEVLGYVKPPPLIPEGNRWFIITGTALQSALSGKQSVKEAMDDAAKQVQQLLASAGYYK
jgi:ABC-type glycerol-3-phosphate transport system substrate-binding protein